MKIFSRALVGAIGILLFSVCSTPEEDSVNTLQIGNKKVRLSEESVYVEMDGASAIMLFEREGFDLDINEENMANSTIEGAGATALLMLRDGIVSGTHEPMSLAFCESITAEELLSFNIGGCMVSNDQISIGRVGDSVKGVSVDAYHRGSAYHMGEDSVSAGFSFSGLLQDATDFIFSEDEDLDRVTISDLHIVSPNNAEEKGIELSFENGTISIVKPSNLDESIREVTLAYSVGQNTTASLGDEELQENNRVTIDISNLDKDNQKEEYTLTITAENGDDSIYTISVTYLPSGNNTISELHIVSPSDAEGIEFGLQGNTISIVKSSDLDESIREVTLGYSVDEKATAYLGGEKLDENNRVTINISALDKDTPKEEYTLTITAENGDDSIYTISLTYLIDDNVSISNLRITSPPDAEEKGIELSFEDDTISIVKLSSLDKSIETVTLAYSVGKDTTAYLGGEKLDENNRVTIDISALDKDNQKEEYTLTITAENVDDSTYTISVTYLPSDNNTISDIVVTSPLEPKESGIYMRTGVETVLDILSETAETAVELSFSIDDSASASFNDTPLIDNSVTIPLSDKTDTVHTLTIIAEDGSQNSHLIVVKFYDVVEVSVEEPSGSGWALVPSLAATTSVSASPNGPVSAPTTGGDIPFQHEATALSLLYKVKGIVELNREYTTAENSNSHGINFVSYTENYDKEKGQGDQDSYGNGYGVVNGQGVEPFVFKATKFDDYKNIFLIGKLYEISGVGEGWLYKISDITFNGFGVPTLKSVDVDDKVYVRFIFTDVRN